MPPCGGECRTQHEEAYEKYIMHGTRHSWNQLERNKFQERANIEGEETMHRRFFDSPRKFTEIKFEV